MPALTVDTNPQRSGSRSRSPTPDPPPMSPMTPTEEQPPPAAASSSSATTTNTTANSNTTTSTIPPAATLSHNSHPSQPTTMPAPPPEPIDFANNTDAIALQSTLSILSMQKRRAEEHIRLLANTKDDAKANPEQTAAHLEKGGDEAPWKDAFKPQSIARSPNINWDKYAIVGESLDKIAKEQATHPQETRPSVWVDGKYQEQPGGPSSARGEEYKGAFSAVSPFENRKENDRSKR